MGPHKPFKQQPMQKNLKEDTATLENCMYSVDLQGEEGRHSTHFQNDNQQNLNDISGFS